MGDDAIPAATLILWRDPAPGSGTNPEILVVERSARMAFAGGAVVFPGGRIDAGDSALAEALGRPDDAAKITAMRETIEETAVLPGLNGTVDPDLGLELHRRGTDQWKLQAGAGIADCQAGYEIVASIDHQRMAVEKGSCIAAIDPVLDRNRFDERVDPADKVGRQDRLGQPGLVGPENRLAMQIGCIDDIVIDDRQLSNAGAGQRRDDGTADSAGANHDGAGLLQSRLTGTADLRQDDLACIALKLCVRKIHRPVEPNPPLPRAVSINSMASEK